MPRGIYLRRAGGNGQLVVAFCMLIIYLFTYTVRSAYTLIYSALN